MIRLVTFAATLLLAAPVLAASPDAWEAYEAQIRVDCAAVLSEQGLSVSGEGSVAHGSDELGSFLILTALAGDGTATSWLCHAPRGEGELAVELIELPPGYEIGFADEL